MRIGKRTLKTRSRRPIRVTIMSIKQPVRPTQSLTFRDTPLTEDLSMPDKSKRQERQMTLWESDDCIVPLKLEDQSSELKSGNTGAGKAVRPLRVSDTRPVAHGGDSTVFDRLNRITNRSETHPEEVFNNLFTLLSDELLRSAFGRLKKNKAPGVDSVTVDQYEEHLGDNLSDLLTGLHRGTYRPQPSLRCDIPKGNGKTRPLGIAAVEDKIVQRAIVMILERIYEVDFVDRSYGFRPGRSCHDALRDLGRTISKQKANFVLDADIRGFFDNVSHERLVELLRKRINDPRMLALIERFLKAGVMIDGDWLRTDKGVPQGSVLSPLLANVYLHYVLDEWFERDVKPRLQGEACMVRYADDFICTFQYESDAIRFQSVLAKRLGRFSLELAEEKTKLLRFGRFALRDSQRLGEGAPGTFDFLGFTHYCGLSRARRFKLKRKTATKKWKAKLRDLKDWFRTHLTTPVAQVWTTLNQKLRGHYQYYGINDNWPWLMRYRRAVLKLAFRWMNRRSQKTSKNWSEFHTYVERHPVASPKKLTDLIATK